MTDWDDKLDAAFDAYENQRFDEAEALCREVVGDEPQNIEALHILGVIAGATGRSDEGIALLRQVIALDADYTDALADLGHLLKQAERHDEAIALLKRAVGLDPQSVPSLNNLGEAYVAVKQLSEAVECFDRALALSPDLALLHYNRGVALEQQHRANDAIAAHRRALTLSPGLAEPAVRLAFLLLERGEQTEALSLIAASQPDSELGLQAAALIDLQAGRAAVAEDRLRSVSASELSTAATLCLYGSVLSRLGRFEEARASYDRALALDDSYGPAYAGIVTSRKIVPADRPMLAKIAALLEGTASTTNARVLLNFALGKAYDDLGEFESAIRYFDEGNRMEAHRLREIGRVIDGQSLAQDISGVIASATRRMFASHASIGCDSELPVLIVGMPRSGTTLVEQILSSHPDIAAGDELTYWNDRAGMIEPGKDPLTPEFCAKAATDYIELLRSFSPTARRVTDKMPFNFLSLGLVHAIFPRARIIHCRRHPIDTCLSIYFTNFSELQDFCFDRAKLVEYYGQYRRMMAHWRRVLPPERYIEIDYEDMVDDRERVTRQLIAFCGLEWSDDCLRHESNTRAVKTASMWQARQPIYRSSLARWRNYERWLGEFNELRALDEAS